MLKPRKKPTSLDLEKIVGLVTCSFNALNSHLKSTLDDDSRALFLSHFAELAKFEAKVITGPVSEVVEVSESA